MIMVSAAIITVLVSTITPVSSGASLGAVRGGSHSLSFISWRCARGPVRTRTQYPCVGVHELVVHEQFVSLQDRLASLFTFGLCDGIKSLPLLFNLYRKLLAYPVICVLEVFCGPFNSSQVLIVNEFGDDRSLTAPYFWSDPMRIFHREFALLLQLVAYDRLQDGLTILGTPLLSLIYPVKQQIILHRTATCVDCLRLQIVTPFTQLSNSSQHLVLMVVNALTSDFTDRRPEQALVTLSCTPSMMLLVP